MLHLLKRGGNTTSHLSPTNVTRVAKCAPHVWW